MKKFAAARGRLPETDGAVSPRSARACDDVQPRAREPAESTRPRSRRERWSARTACGTARIEPEEQRRQRRTDHRAGVVHPAMEAVHLAARLRRRKRGEQGVARRAANALADAIDEPDCEDLRPRLRQRNQRTHRRRQRVAAEHERPLGARAIGPPSRQTFSRLLTASAAPSTMPSETAPAPRTCVRKNGSSG